MIPGLAPRTLTVPNVARSRRAEDLRLLSIVIISIATVVLTTLAVQIGWQSPESDFFGFYRSAQAMRAGGDAYQDFTNLNPPAVVALFVPLTLVSAPTAFLLWTVLSVAVLAMAVVHIGHVLRVRDSWVIVLGILATAASFIGLKLGQVGFVLTAIVTAAWSAERKHRPLASGIAIGAAIYAKPFLGLLLLRAIWRRAWTTTVAAVVVALAFVLFGLLVGGWSSYVAWNDRLHNIEWVGYTLNLNGSVTGLLTRTLTSVAPAFHVRPLVVVKSINLWLAVADLCVLAALVWRTREAEIDQSWAAILLGSLLLSPLGWIYYLPIAIGPLVGVWQRATRVTRGWLALGWLLACVPAVPTPFHLGPVGTLLWGSCPTWATLSLFIGALLPPRTQLVEPKPKKDLSMDLHVLYEPTESIA